MSGTLPTGVVGSTTFGSSIITAGRGGSTGAAGFATATGAAGFATDTVGGAGFGVALISAFGGNAGTGATFGSPGGAGCTGSIGLAMATGSTGFAAIVGSDVFGGVGSSEGFGVIGATGDCNGDVGESGVMSGPAIFAFASGIVGGRVGTNSDRGALASDDFGGTGTGRGGKGDCIPPVTGGITRGATGVCGAIGGVRGPPSDAMPADRYDGGFVNLDGEDVTVDVCGQSGGAFAGGAGVVTTAGDSWRVGFGRAGVFST